MPQCPLCQQYMIRADNKGIIWECFCKTNQLQYMQWGDQFEFRQLYLEDGSWIRIFNKWNMDEWELNHGYQVCIASGPGNIDLTQTQELWEWVQMCLWLHQ